MVGTVFNTPETSHAGKLNIWENDYIYPDSVIQEIRSGSLEKILEVAEKTLKN